MGRIDQYDNYTDAPGETIAMDWDGTGTKVWELAAMYQDLIHEQLAVDLHMDRSDVDAGMGIASAMIHADPIRYQFMYNGIPSVFADSDPYLLTGTAVQIFLQHCGRKIPGGLDISDYGSKLHYHAHRQLPEAPKEGLADCLEFLQSKGRLVIISNSAGDPIEGSLEKLGFSKGEIPVVPKAGKLVIDPSYNELVKSVWLKGTPGRIHTRRKQYHQTLKAQGPLLAVIGDIPELDLLAAMIDKSGVVEASQQTCTILVASEHTPEWAQKLYENNPKLNGTTVYSLEDLAAYIEKL